MWFQSPGSVTQHRLAQGFWRDGDGAPSCSTGTRAQEGDLGDRKDIPWMARCHKGKTWTGRAAQ